jgi:hypothetical protein
MHHERGAELTASLTCGERLLIAWAKDFIGPCGRGPDHQPLTLEPARVRHHQLFRGCSARARKKAGASKYYGR